jgi:hypothetical protein
MWLEGLAMETTVSEEIWSDASLSQIVRRSNDVLVRAMGRSKHPPRAVWRLLPRPGQTPVIQLELVDELDSVTRQFLPEELSDEYSLHFKLTELWGDLIQLAFRTSTERMVSALREMRQDEESRGHHLQEA